MNAFATLLFVFLLAGCSTANERWLNGYKPQAGDLVFQSLPRNALVDAIEGMTESPFSHCGIVVQQDGRWMVREAIGTVHDTPLRGWITRGRAAGFVAYRFTAALEPKIPAIIQASADYLDRPYDIHYDMDEEAIYCSELLYKAISRATEVKVGSLKKMGEMPWKPHEQVIRSIENGALPLDRIMITPRAMTEDPHLREVFRFNIPKP